MDKIYYLAEISQAFLTISWVITEKGGIDSAAD